jgi:hypothetical protein
LTIGSDPPRTTLHTFRVRGLLSREPNFSYLGKRGPNVNHPTLECCSCSRAAQASASLGVGSRSARVARIAALRSDSGSRRAARSSSPRRGLAERHSSSSPTWMALALALTGPARYYRAPATYEKCKQMLRVLRDQAAGRQSRGRTSVGAEPPSDNPPAGPEKPTNGPN